MSHHELPDPIDLFIVGGGTAGAALAGLVTRDTNRSVVLLEAGPDYGPLAGGRWPADLLDARHLGLSHEWGYSGLAHPIQATATAFNRACVIGGCSAHNGCVALLGHRHDYDTWAALGNTGWDWESVAPAFARAKAGLRVRLVEASEIVPYHASFIEGAVAAGIPRVRDLNDPDDRSGVAASPVNINRGIRWNSALGYVDPVRDHPNLTIIDNALVERVELRGNRAVAVEAIVDGERVRVPATRIVLAAGAYSSPAILLRSGIGAPEELRALGIAPLHALPGVGRNLADHATIVLRFRGTERLDRAMREFETRQWRPDEQTLLKTTSSWCREAFDLHLYSVATSEPGGEEWVYTVCISVMPPRSAGALTLASADPSAHPLIDHGYLSDQEGQDLGVLLDGIAIAREMMAAPSIAWAIGGEVGPSAGLRTREELTGFIHRNVGIYCHPGCTCRMGPASDPLAVVAPNAQVHGLDGLSVCDAAVFPTLMRANTNLPAAMVAEHLAASLGG